MSSEPQKVHRDMVDTDRVSNLPEQVLDLILSFLPLRDVVRTSILSTAWRYKWTTVPRLVFEKNCYSASWKSTAANETEALAGIDHVLLPRRCTIYETKALARIIDHVLLLHTGTVEVLKIKDIRAIPNIDRWIPHLCGRSVKVLVLKVCSAEMYRPPSSLYSCESLVKLKLTNCLVNPPSSFDGFKCLKFLFLGCCTLVGGAFEDLISSSRLLEKLTLIDLHGHLDLETDAPNLQSVHINSHFERVAFGCKMTKLSNVTISVEYFDADYMSSGSIEFFINIPNVQRLETNHSFLRYLAVGYVPERMPFQLRELHHLILWVDLFEPNGSLAALCLFNSSPNLTDLEIKVWDDIDAGEDAPSIFTDGTGRHCRFEKLRRLRMNFFDGKRAEVEFMKLVLANSPVLEKVTLSFRSEYYDRLALMEMSSFERLSPNAEFIFDPSSRPTPDEEFIFDPNPRY